MPKENLTLSFKQKNLLKKFLSIAEKEEICKQAAIAEKRPKPYDASYLHFILQGKRNAPESINKILKERFTQLKSEIETA